MTTLWTDQVGFFPWAGAIFNLKRGGVCVERCGLEGKWVIMAGKKYKTNALRVISWVLRFW
jgi:hypothetical protein